MMALGVLALGVAPGLLWLWFFYRKDRFEPEPKQLVLKVFFLGMVAVIPAYLVERNFIQFYAFTLVLVAPVVEELLKFFVVWKFVYSDKEFNEPMDGIVYAAAAALGFAAAENPIYLFDALGGGTTLADLSAEFWMVFAVRALLTVPGHALWSSMWGYALGRAKFSTEKGSRRVIAAGLAMAIGFHALHNGAAAFVSEWAPIAVLVLAVVYWRIVMRQVRRALADSPFAPGAVGKQGGAMQAAEEGAGDPLAAVDAGAADTEAAGRAVDAEPTGGNGTKT